MSMEIIARKKRTTFLHCEKLRNAVSYSIVKTPIYNFFFFLRSNIQNVERDLVPVGSSRTQQRYFDVDRTSFTHGGLI